MKFPDLSISAKPKKIKANPDTGTTHGQACVDACVVSIDATHASTHAFIGISIVLDLLEKIFFLGTIKFFKLLNFSRQLWYLLIFRDVDFVFETTDEFDA